MKAALCPLLLAAACAPADVAATQVVVLVGGDPRVTKLDVRVLDEAGSATSGALSILLARRAPYALPTSFTVVPARGAEGGRFRVIVQGVASDAAGDVPLARSEAVARFTPQATVLLPVVLAAGCADERCGCSGTAGCLQTCEQSGLSVRCSDVPRFDALTGIEPGEELSALRDGQSACPRGSWPGPDGACDNLDECAFALDDCSRAPSACVDALVGAGRYRCECPAGYAGTGEADDPCVPCADCGASRG